MSGDFDRGDVARLVAALHDDATRFFSELDGGRALREDHWERPGGGGGVSRVLGDGGSVSVPYGSYKGTLLTVETAPQLDPGVAERKWYVAGVGDIKEHTVSGNHEEIVLVSVTH